MGGHLSRASSKVHPIAVAAPSAASLAAAAAHTATAAAVGAEASALLSTAAAAAEAQPAALTAAATFDASTIAAGAGARPAALNQKDFDTWCQTGAQERRLHDIPMMDKSVHEKPVLDALAAWQHSRNFTQESSFRDDLARLQRASRTGSSQAYAAISSALVTIHGATPVDGTARRVWTKNLANDLMVIYFVRSGDRPEEARHLPTFFEMGKFHVLIAGAAAAKGDRVGADADCAVKEFYAGIAVDFLGKDRDYRALCLFGAVVDTLTDTQLFVITETMGSVARTLAKVRSCTRLAIGTSQTPADLITICGASNVVIDAVVLTGCGTGKLSEADVWSRANALGASLDEYEAGANVDFDLFQTQLEDQAVTLDAVRTCPGMLVVSTTVLSGITDNTRITAETIAAISSGGNNHGLKIRTRFFSEVLLPSLEVVRSGVEMATMATAASGGSGAGSSSGAGAATAEPLPKRAKIGGQVNLHAAVNNRQCSNAECSLWYEGIDCPFCGESDVVDLT